jgi:hypothetical protein
VVCLAADNVLDGNPDVGAVAGVIRFATGP